MLHLFFRSSLHFLFAFLFFSLTGCNDKNERFQGYVDGRYTYVASNVSGRVKNLWVSRGDEVNREQPLFVLEPEPEKSQLEDAKSAVLQARDQLASAEAGLKLAEITLSRQSALIEKNAIDRQTVDQSRTQKDQAVANRDRAESQLKSAEASLRKAQWYYSEKNIQSPKNAFVFDTLFLPGELVQAAVPIVALISKKDIYVIFYVNGILLSRLKINQVVKILPSGGNEAIQAKITYISPTAEYAPPIIYSNETNEKLVFRIEATPLIPTYDLHPGAPVEIRF